MKKEQTYITLDGKHTVKRCSNWISIKEARPVNANNSLFVYATDKRGTWSIYGHFDKKSSTCKYFTYQGQKYPLPRFKSLKDGLFFSDYNNITIIKNCEFIDSTGSKISISDFDLDSNRHEQNYTLLCIEYNNEHDKVRVYTVQPVH